MSGTNHITSTVTPKLDVKLERNTKGFNWEVKLSQADAATPEQIDEALKLLAYTKHRLETSYGSGVASGGAQ